MTPIDRTLAIEDGVYQVSDMAHHRTSQILKAFLAELSYPRCDELYKKPSEMVEHLDSWAASLAFMVDYL